MSKRDRGAFLERSELLTLSGREIRGGLIRLFLLLLPSSNFANAFVGPGRAARKMLFPRNEGTLTGPPGAQDTECFNTPVSGRSRELCHAAAGT